MSKRTKIKVLIVATSRKTRGGITSVIKAHETGEQWKKYHCRWIETHRDGGALRKMWYFLTALVEYTILLPFYDIVHIHTADRASAKRKLLFGRIAKLFNKKVVVHLHLGDASALFDVERNISMGKEFELADKIIVLSPMWKRWVEKVFPTFSEKITVLYNPCPPYVSRCGGKKEKYILYAGTILRRKGYDVLLKGFGEIAKKHSDWKVKFAGNPYLIEGINELEDGKHIAEELDISNQVEWLGWISGEKKDEVFKKASIYCLASESEGFPMGVLDAWAYGIPCVMTPVGGIPDIVTDGKEGLLFPIGDVDKLAEQLDKLMSSEGLRGDIVRKTDKLVKDEFCAEVVCKQLDKIYSSLC